MSEEWSIDSARVLDIGGDGERVRRLSVAIVGGRVDVVTHTDSPTARVEIAQVERITTRSNELQSTSSCHTTTSASQPSPRSASAICGGSGST